MRVGKNYTLREEDYGKFQMQLRLKELSLLSLFSLLVLSPVHGDDAPENFGRAVFLENCAECHGAAGQGLTEDWKTPLADGTFPPPPINGTGHAWHHSPAALLNTIDHGGVPLGGVMPGFKDKLNQREKQALLDFIYSLWPKEIQRMYDKHFKE